MEELVKGDIAVLPFPFSDLSSTKKRPALVLAALTGDDIICCQITSKARLDEYAISLEDSNLVMGSLHQSSMIRPNKIFTADRSSILHKVGVLEDAKMKETVDKIVKIFTGG